MHATYSPEDNKLRLYPSSRLPRELYERVREAGFIWAGKQELFVAPSWTPQREDFLLELCEEIEAEDYSPEERAADRAERFAGYREKRMGEATGHADRFENGPGVFGHQNQARAERQAARHDRIRGKVCSQWAKAEYWQTRTTAVISHALYKSSAPVRRSRILRLEAEQRKHEKTLEEYSAMFKLWQGVSSMAGADEPIPYESGSGFCGLASNATPAARAAYTLANMAQCYGKYNHPRTGREGSLYSLMSDMESPITPREAAFLWLEGRIDPNDPDSNGARWKAHYENRLTYERTMLAEEGGSAADAEMIPGGFIGKHQIHAVNKSPVTGRVVSVKLMAPEKWYRSENGEPAPLTLQSFNVERLPEGSYRAPTAEELNAFQAATKAAKAAKKASTPKAPPLINPTDEDAERLQAIWNDRAREAHIKRGAYGEFQPVNVRRMTQAEYSAASKGSYTSLGTADVTEQLRERRSTAMRQEVAGRVTVFKVRRSGSSMYEANRVVIITDKPQKPIPWDEAEAIYEQQPSIESMTPRLPELVKALRSNGAWLPKKEQEEEWNIINDAIYIGWAYVSSMSQFGLTEKGQEAYRQFQAERELVTI